MYDSITDIEGNIYKTVKINDQWWMAQNLATTTFRDGSPILNITEDTDWEFLSDAAYSWYENDLENYGNTYGALYNWYAVNTEKLCPSGWHVSTDEEWTQLTEYLGGESAAQNKLKEMGSSHWLTPNTESSDEFGFTALPGGHRWDDAGWFDGNGLESYWWTSTFADDELYIDLIGERGGHALCRQMVRNHNFRTAYWITQGLSIRCVKD